MSRMSRRTFESVPNYLSSCFKFLLLNKTQPMSTTLDLKMILRISKQAPNILMWSSRGSVNPQHFYGVIHLLQPCETFFNQRIFEHGIFPEKAYRDVIKSRMIISEKVCHHTWCSDKSFLDVSNKIQVPSIDLFIFSPNRDATTYRDNIGIPRWGGGDE